MSSALNVFNWWPFDFLKVSVFILKLKYCGEHFCGISAIHTGNWNPFSSKVSSWSFSYGSWIYNYICNQCLPQLILCVRIPLRRCVLDSTLCDKVCQWLAAGRWFSPVTTISSSKKTERHEIPEILLKGVLNAIAISPFHSTVEFIVY